MQDIAPMDVATIRVARAAAARHAHDPHALLQILRDIQDELGHLPSWLFDILAGLLGITRARVEGVASFYSLLRHERSAKYEILYVHADPAAIDLEGGLAWQLRRRHGAQIELLEGAALHEAEPALSRAYTRGVRMGPMGYTTHPLRLAQAYAALSRRLGATLMRGEVRSLQPQPDGVTVNVDGVALAASLVVVAAGAWTRSLLRPLGIDVPLVAERGYHLTYADPGLTLQHVVSDIGAHVAVTSMETGLRIAGTEEIGLADDPPDWRRAQVLDRVLRRLLPAARLGQGQAWMGPRPGTPDSLPLVGKLPGLERVIVAAGHGHLGLTGAPHTGAIVAALAGGEAPGIDLAPFAPQRFGG